MYSVEASYRETDIDRFKNNPYIEALPAMMSNQMIMDLFYYQPQVSDEDRLLNDNQRLLKLGSIEDFLAPLEIHQEIYRNIYTMICDGYTRRNPYNYDDLKLIREEKENPEIWLTSQNFNQRPKKPYKSLCSTRLFLGVSGIGKTTTIERIMQFFPQVISHTYYKNRKLTRTQITYLKVDCPHNALTTTFCHQFLKAFDDALDINIYEYQALIENHSFNSMISTIRGLIHKYGVGIIFIDEVQNLIQEDQDARELADLFVSMINYLQVPIYFIGTPKFLKILDLNLRSKRRFNSDGLILWDRLKEESNDWDIFIHNLWELQFTKTFTPLNEELKHTLYEYTQGILAFVTTLFRAVQQTLILDKENHDEIITPKIIKQVSLRVFSPYQKLLQAIRENNREVIESYEDLSFDVLENDITLAKSIQDKTKDHYTEYQLKEKAQKEKEVSELLYLYLKGQDCFEFLKFQDLKQVCQDVLNDFGIKTDLKILKQKCFLEALHRNESLERLSKSRKDNKEEPKNLLNNLYNQAHKNQKTVSDLLDEKGLRGFHLD